MGKKMHKVTSLIFMAGLFVIVALAPATGGEKQVSNLKILDVKFEPIRQGKNIVHVKAQNTSRQDQVLKVGIYTRSPDYGRNGIGWGTSFSETIRPQETKWARFAFKIQGPITDETLVRLNFFNPDSLQSNERKEHFEQRMYASGDLEHYKVEQTTAKPASEAESKAVVEAFRQIQNLIREQKYEQAWQFFTKDYQDAEFQSPGLDAFKRIMNPNRPIDSAFWWEKEDFLNLQPSGVVVRDGVFALTAIDEKQSWTIDFVLQENKWKIDWIAGYTPRILQWQNWEERLLPTMEKRSTKHFDIYYFKNSTAAREIDKIAEQKDKGFAQICKFLGKESDLRIRLVLFEDGRTKHAETGHQGRGWAYGNTIVEVYNEQEQLDPFHETTHILMRPFGNPPALFNEGFAVYISERLGAYALEDLSGGRASIYERVRELKRKGQWIELEKLITFREIGSQESRPPVAYAEAASFVKFLIDTYGKDKFLRAYKELKNSNSKIVHWTNKMVLQNIYGKQLSELQEEWEKAFQKE
jgi:hypothetical protein